MYSTECINSLCTYVVIMRWLLYETFVLSCTVDSAIAVLRHVGKLSRRGAHYCFNFGPTRG